MSAGGLARRGPAGARPGRRAIGPGRGRASRSATGRAVLALLLAPAWSNGVLPRLGLPRRGRTAANLLFALAFSRSLGGRPRWRSRSGLRWGAGSAAVVLAGYGAALAIPGPRRALVAAAGRAPEVSTVEWALLHIPVGTVLAEESVFRGTIDPLLAEAAGPSGVLLGAVDFGLWHVAPARAAGDPVGATVAITTLAGVLFSELRRRSGSATAPALLHLAINAGGAVAPILASRLDRRRAAPAGSPIEGWRSRAGRGVGDGR
ncbi:CPBP family intramembrane glutamic endopeptidase [Nocardia thailandica]|uniref:CPBP family intramembrane glutamic endopeptidase n=1 Tax=Nocardia thailandica TaxID=257275 RepID=UPI0003154760|nr:CPBP family intramembrane glutamic endopeptidase [Nocardia thailandica]